MANQNMTLTQQNKMYNSGIPMNNCVIVSSNYIGQNSSQKRVLAPAPERNSVVITNNNSDLRCKRKIQFIPNHTGSGGTMQPASVARRNARERNRVKQVNNGFAALRQHIPPNILAAFTPPNGNTSATGRGANKKLSKVETLKMAVEYIRSLQDMLEDHEAEMGTKNDFYTNSPEQYSYPIILPTPPASESSSSPTPSESSSSTPVFTSPTIYKQYGYDNYEPNSPEDEELLDAIFSWQQNS